MHERTDHWQRLDAWWDTPYGEVMWRAEVDQLRRSIAQHKPAMVLQAGGRALLDQACEVQTEFIHIVTEQTSSCIGGRIRADLLRLPVPADSVDMVVCPHVHEVIEDTERFFLELFRVLKPRGLLLCYSSNTAGIWGLQRCFYPRARPTWDDGRHAARRDLRRSPFMPHSHKSMCFRPWSKSAEWLKKWQALEGMVPLCLPHAGSIDVHLLRKHVIPMNFVWCSEQPPAA